MTAAKQIWKQKKKEHNTNNDLTSSFISKSLISIFNCTCMLTWHEVVYIQHNELQARKNGVIAAFKVNGEKQWVLCNSTLHLLSGKLLAWVAAEIELSCFMGVRDRLASGDLSTFSTSAVANSTPEWKPFRSALLNLFQESFLWDLSASLTVPLF